jgi:BlaI family transcriptional regulator, penicillinase repressor
MARPASRHPTELELEMLKILWRDGPSLASHIRDELAGFRELAHTSVLTILNIMVRKGYLKRTKGGKSYTFSTRVTERETTREMLGDLVDRAFDGSAGVAMVNLLETSDVDRTELVEIQRLVDRMMKEETP